MTDSRPKMPEGSPAGPGPIAFNDLAAQQARILPELQRAMARVLDHGRYIMGPEVGALEQQLAAFCGARHCVSCSSGTDALLMVLMARGIGAGDAVICPAFTFTATPEVVALLGATPVFADVCEDSFNLDPAKLPGALDAAKAAGLRPKAIIAVDLFGLPADYERIAPFAESHGLWVLADAAQSFGASCNGRKVGRLGLATATSFFPAKPLGCYGDGGAILTDDDELAGSLKSIRAHGKGSGKYDIVRIGVNGRLDTLQAAIVIEKLKIFPDEIEARGRVAGRYTAALKALEGVGVPLVPESVNSVWAQFTLRVPATTRGALAQTLGQAGIPTAVYYPKALHDQTAYSNYPVPKSGLRVAETLATEVLSVPMHAYLSEAAIDHIAGAIASALSTAG